MATLYTVELANKTASAPESATKRFSVRGLLGTELGSGTALSPVNVIQSNDGLQLELGARNQDQTDGVNSSIQ
jgi:hypothetical protein